MTHKMTFYFSVLAFILFSNISHVALAQESDDKIQLQLFNQSEVKNWNDCHIALWQHNKTPGEDKYYYGVFIPILDNGNFGPAKIEVGGTSYKLDIIAQNHMGDFGLSSVFILRDTGNDFIAQIDITKAFFDGSTTEIENAEMELFQSGKKSFTLSLKGQATCISLLTETAHEGMNNTSNSSQIITATEIGTITGVSEIPKSLQRILSNDFTECETGMGPDVSTLYALSNGDELWALPCFSGAYQYSNSFGVIPADGSGAYPIFVEMPPEEGSISQSLFNPEIAEGGSTVESTIFGRGIRDCGSFFKHKIIVNDGGRIDFQLQEYRSKPDCDGKEMTVGKMRLIYQR